MFNPEAQYEEPPTPPYTVYGLVSKRFIIEDLKGERIVSRRKGTTVTACASVVSASDETPDTLRLSNALKVGQVEPQSCSVERYGGAVSTTGDLKPVCVPACRSACAGALDTHNFRLIAETGFGLQPAARARVEKACVRSCAYECVAPGRSFEFVVPERP
jgi:hypothetical protein